MAETTINQRIKFLMESLSMKAGTFSRALGVSETNIRNYTDRTSKPGADILEKIATNFKQVNLAWLLTGEGEPFKDESLPQNHTHVSGNKNNIAVAGTNNGTASQTTNLTIDEFAQNLNSCRAQLEKLEVENQSLRNELGRADALIGAKEALIVAQAENLRLLRGGLDRMN